MRPLQLKHMSSASGVHVGLCCKGSVKCEPELRLNMNFYHSRKNIQSLVSLNRSNIRIFFNLRRKILTGSNSGLKYS